jgi:hypothetical protein
LHRKETTGNANYPNGYTYYEADDPVYFLKKVNDTLFMPIIKYMTISTSPGIVRFVSSKLSNVFSAEGVSHLAANDTLVIQSFDIAFVKEG